MRSGVVSNAALNLAVARNEQAARFVPRGPLVLDPRAFGSDLSRLSTAPRAYAGNDVVAVIDIVGPVVHHEEKPSDGPAACVCPRLDSYDAIKRRNREAAASSAKCGLLNIDCPGGLVAGCFDTVAEIRKIWADAGKPLYAYIDAQATSGGYALACAASKIFIPSTGIAGSIGVIDTLIDETAADSFMGRKYTLITSGDRKSDGNPHTPISNEAIAAAQSMVDALSWQFHRVVSEARGISAETVKGFQCGLFCGQEAIDAGLADEMATFDEVIAKLSAGDAVLFAGNQPNEGLSVSARRGPLAGDFKEEDHPRSDDGKFGSGGGGAKKSDDKSKGKSGDNAESKSSDSDDKSVTSEKHGVGKVRTKEDLAKELPKDKNGKQGYGGFPLETINKVHEFSGETGLKAIIYRKDRKGKEVQVYQYTKEHEQAHADAKFTKAVKMGENIDAIRKRAEGDSASADRKTSDAAVVVRLIDSTTIRVGGSDSEKDTGSVGATTLRVEHVIKNTDGSVNLKFPGKSHKEWDRRIEGDLAKEIIKRTEGKQPRDRVFGVSASDVNGYLEKASPDKITAKDFRTFHASSLAFDILSKSSPPPKIPAKEAEANIKKAIEATSQHLGNTPAICKEKYINPRVLDAYRNRVIESEAA